MQINLKNYIACKWYQYAEYWNGSEPLNIIALSVVSCTYRKTKQKWLNRMSVIILEVLSNPHSYTRTLQAEPNTRSAYTHSVSAWWAKCSEIYSMRLFARRANWTTLCSLRRVTINWGHCRRVHAVFCVHWRDPWEILRPRYAQHTDEAQCLRQNTNRSTDNWLYVVCVCTFARSLSLTWSVAEAVAMLWCERDRAKRACVGVHVFEFTLFILLLVQNCRQACLLRPIELGIGKKPVSYETDRACVDGSWRRNCVAQSFPCEWLL